MRTQRLRLTILLLVVVGSWGLLGQSRSAQRFITHSLAEGTVKGSAPAADEQQPPQKTFPVIKSFGGVFRLPSASHQPRAGSRIVVDVTQGGSPQELNSAIEKVARYINIYGGAGEAAADVTIAVVLHGDATLTVLNDDAYATRFDTASNPNLNCLRQLHEAGVEIFVCGQSLLGKNASPDDVVDLADVAVSALTAVVNLQSDGYVRIPL